MPVYLTGWEVQDLQRSDEDGINVEARYLIHPPQCPHCGAEKFRVHSVKPRSYTDAPVHGKRVTLTAQRARYVCENGHTFIQSPDDLDADASITARARRYIEHQALRAPFSATAERIGLSTNTVREFSHRYFDSIDECKRPCATAAVAAIEVQLGERSALLLLDAQRSRAIDLIDLENADASQAIRAAIDPQSVLYRRASAGRGARLMSAALPGAQDDGLTDLCWTKSTVEAFEACSARVAFAAVRARVLLWGDLSVLSSALLADHREQCSECLAICRPEELLIEQTRVTVDAKPQFMRHRICTACASLRTPMWFHRTDEFV